ncbi:hypothetical protein C6H70_21800, partial [Klebsiella pneumoniae]
MVRTLLTELADYPEAYRRQINVLSFIQRRTNLSRSRIMSILSELRKGGYITVHRGVPIPTAHGRDLLVAVKAISVNPVDTKVRAGFQGDTPRVLGWDA